MLLPTSQGCDEKLEVKALMMHIGIVELGRD